MPSERASGGMRERKRRAGFERGEKGLKVTRTSVRNLVIMAATERRGLSRRYFSNCRVNEDATTYQ